ncbi:hypothetical protein GCM10017708_12430 [Arthrobacter citreus]
MRQVRHSLTIDLRHESPMRLLRIKRYPFQSTAFAGAVFRVTAGTGAWRRGLGRELSLGPGKYVRDASTDAAVRLESSAGRKPKADDAPIPESCPRLIPETASQHPSCR